MLSTQARKFYKEEHNMFRDTVRKVFDKEMVPHLDKHEEEGIVGREAWKAMGDAGLLGMTVPEEMGGLGLDFSFNAIFSEELAYMRIWADIPIADRGKSYY